jgi:hypothetical protein
MMPNKPDAVNPAMALRFAIEDQWRRVTDLERSNRTDSPQRTAWSKTRFNLNVPRLVDGIHRFKL